MPNTQSNSDPDYLVLGSGLAGLSFAALIDTIEVASAWKIQG